MSQENVDLARRTYAAFNEALTTDAFRPIIQKFCDPEIVIQPSGTFPETSELRGHDGMLSFLRLNTEAFESFRLEPLEFIDAGDKVVVPVRFGGRARHTGLEVTFDSVHIWTARGEKWARLELIRERAEALEAVGLSEQDAHADS
jgi:ketosteroid isomerase-like protein